MDVHFFRKKTTRWGGASCVLGIVLASFAVYANASIAPEDRTLLKVSLDLVLFGATTFLSLGLVTMILDMPGWKQYFEDGLMGVVLRHEFLRMLSKEQLTEFQIKVFKKFYEKEDIDQEDRFLRYCLEHIHKYIIEPYREGVHEQILVEQWVPGSLKVSETLVYNCRAGKGEIQEKLSWGMNEETQEVQNLRFELQIPSAYRDDKNPEKLVWSKEELTPVPNTTKGLVDYELSLKGFRHMDRLNAIISATYLIDASRFYSWRMVVPSKGVRCTIVYPKEMRLQFVPFLLDRKPDQQRDDSGLFSITFSSWIMPWSGFAWKLRPGSAAEAQAFLPDDLRGPETHSSPMPLQ